MKRYWKGNWLLPASTKLTNVPTILVYSLPILLLVIGLNLEPLVSCAREARDNNDPNDKDADWHYPEMRPMMGYFSDIKAGNFGVIYKDYWERVTATNDPKLPKKFKPDEWPRLRPFASDCIYFLINTQQNNYVLKKPHEIILLDACLDWLYPRYDYALKEKKRDIEKLKPKSLKSDIPELENDTKFKLIFEETAFKDQTVPYEVMDVIQNYLLRLMDIYVLHPGLGCHSLWLEAYDDFLEHDYLASCTDIADCEVYLNWSEAGKDSYVRMIYESTKAAAEKCYNVLTKSVPKYLNEEYKAVSTMSTAIIRFFDAHTTAAVHRQLKSERWTHEMMLILQIAQNSDSNTVVNLGDVARRLMMIKQQDEEHVESFLKSLSDYTKEEANSKTKDAASDSYGHDRYAHAMIKLCHPFVDKSKFMGKLLKDATLLIEERHAFEFFHIVNSLVRLTNFEPAVSRTKDDLERDIIKHNWAALYLATFTCQLVSTTWVERSDETNDEEFDVTLRRGWPAYIRAWPIDYVAASLIHNPPEPPKSPERASPTPTRPARSRSKKSKFFALFCMSPGAVDD